MRIIVLGNAGAGKTRLARDWAGQAGLDCLCLDDLAWEAELVRRPLADSLGQLTAFLDARTGWIVEGCYGDLIEAALPRCTALVFLNPGIETCVRHCLARPWEPDKFPSPEAQRATLDGLLEWVRAYETRDDEFGLRRHRQIFDIFAGPRLECASASDYPDLDGLVRTLALTAPGSFRFRRG